MGTKQIATSAVPAAGWVRDRRLLILQLGCGVPAASALVLFLLSVPALYRRLETPPSAMRVTLAHLHLSPDVYAAYLTAIAVTFSLGCFAVATLIIRRRSDDLGALVASLYLVQLGAANAAYAPAEHQYPALMTPVELSMTLTYALFILLLCLFPDGRFVPRWSRFAASTWIVFFFLTLLLTHDSASHPRNDTVASLIVVGLVLGVIAQIYRYVRISDRLQRQQTKWVVFGVVGAITIQLVLISIPNPVPSLTPASLQNSPYDPVSVTVVSIGYFFIPVAIGIAILRHHLWDIDLLVNRMLVYGALSASLIGIYVAIVGGLGATLLLGGKLPLSLLTTGLVAVLFAPLRDRLQRSINRLMYGERDDPYTVLVRLGQRVESTLAPDAVLPRIVETVAGALKAPYVAITLNQGDAFATAASHGTPGQEIFHLPLTYQGETVGELLLAPRRPREAYALSDRRLLADLARQIGIAVHAVRLTADLQHSRERLVRAREEERRRLRRDLHDGLGPQLAGVMLKLETARNRLGHDPVADSLLTDLAGRTEAAVSDIRRLVYALRPPALDDLGLIPALREAVGQYGERGLTITVEAPESLSQLPAAVEVAAYRIAQEALTNVVRHAAASRCTVRVAMDEAARTLWVEVQDDGRGMGQTSRVGIGLSSMRERAEELGGTWSMQSGPGGTGVCACLPFPRE